MTSIYHDKARFLVDIRFQETVTPERKAEIGRKIAEAISNMPELRISHVTDIDGDWPSY